MTLFKFGRKNSKGVRRMMSDQEPNSLVEPVESTSTTVIDMCPMEGPWVFHPPAYETSANPVAFDYNGQYQMGENPQGMHIYLPNQTFFTSNATPPTSGPSPDVPTSPGASGQPSSGGSPLDLVKGFFESSLPFIVLLIIKISFDHRTGIMLFVAMYGTFIHCNSKAVNMLLPGKLHPRKEFIRGSIIIILIITTSISLLYYAFADQKLYRSLYLLLPLVQPIDLWSMLWVVGATDFVIKFSTVALKLLVAFLPANLLCRRKRGQWYQMVEVVSQLYRSIVPITPWVYFLLEDTGGGGYWLSLILLVAYIVCKCLDLFARLREVWSSLLILMQRLVIGISPSTSELDAIGSCCPICHDLFSEPIMLSCTHVFCEECITAWFDRERTCPMCRSKVQQAPKWRDGQTSSSIQFF